MRISELLSYLPEEKETFYMDVLDISKLPKGKYWLGMVRATTTDRKRQYVAEDSIVGDPPRPFPDYARAILRFFANKRAEPHGRSFMKIETHPPRYARPGRYQDCVYIDLSSAYPTIMAFFYPCKYNRHRYLTLAWEDAKEKLETIQQVDKRARVSAFGIAITNRATILDNTTKNIQFRTVKTLNKLANGDIQKLAYDYLQAIASLIVETCQPVYIHTDGYIIPWDNLGKLEEILGEYWIGKWKIKARGEADIRTAGSYRVGRLYTINYHRTKTGRNYSNIIQPQEARGILSQIQKALQPLK